MQIVICLIPLAVCSFAAIFNLWWLHLVAIGLLLAVAGILPAARKRENVFAFVMTAVTLVPLNIKAVMQMMSWGLFEEYPGVIQVCWAFILYEILFSVEEILLGFAARLLWPKQKNFFSSQENIEAKRTQ